LTVKNSRISIGPFAAISALVLSALATSAPALAKGSSQAGSQPGASREVVQPLPSPNIQRLNRALMELARSPKRLGSLLEAADASLAVGDFDAAIGFYGRAADLEPNDPRVKLGTARVYLRSGRPTEALPRFAAAQAAGAPARDVLTDRALAFDMVGDQESAQKAYLRALELDPDNDVARRRLAISHAISGEADAFQDTLAPLLEQRDFAAFRMRAFGLAIMGESDRASAIVQAVMPPDLAARIVPYLAFMPRLTPAQQAAAANLGIFPRAADIGRDSPRIARMSEGEGADRVLEPSGEPLGTPVPTESREVAQPLPQTGTVRSVTSTPEEPPADMSAAFADLDEPRPSEARARPGAVDLTIIEIPRERPAAAKPEAGPDHPRRIWVQVATGRDLDALAFDWRRFTRRAPELLSPYEPHTVQWGQANRLLAGPLDSDDAARDLVNALAAMGLDTFPYTSPEGTEIRAID